MRAYADSSFILHLVTGEALSPQIVAEYRHLGAPRLFFLPLHDLEVRNGARQRAFHARNSLESSQRAGISRERDAALSRLDRLIARGALVETTIDVERAFKCALEISAIHTERSGARAIDLLHVACALELASERFLTTDARQAQLAKAAGLNVGFLG